MASLETRRERRRPTLPATPRAVVIARTHKSESHATRHAPCRGRTGALRRFGGVGRDHSHCDPVGGSAGIAALLNGGIDFSGAAGSGMRRPLPARSYRASPISGANASAVNDTSDSLITSYFADFGLAPNDFTRIALGTSPGTIIAALKSGAAEAATLDPASQVHAEREGMRVLAFFGDKFPYPFQGSASPIARSPKTPTRSAAGCARMLGLLIQKRDKSTARRICDQATQVRRLRQRTRTHGIRFYIKALPEGVPGVPSPVDLRTVVDYDVRV